MLPRVLFPIFDPPFGKARNTVPLERPVLAMDAAWTSADNTPNFSVTLAFGSLFADDVLRIQIQLAGGGWTSIVSSASHTVTAADLLAGYFDFGLTGLSNANYQASVNYQRNAMLSNWSAPVSFTVSAVTNREWAIPGAYIDSGGARTFATPDAYIVEVTN